MGVRAAESRRRAAKPREEWEGNNFDSRLRRSFSRLRCLHIRAPTKPPANTGYVCGFRPSHDRSLESWQVHVLHGKTTFVTAEREKVLLVCQMLVKFIYKHFYRGVAMIFPWGGPNTVFRISVNVIWDITHSPQGDESSPWG